jgi:hypothetical protein
VRASDGSIADGFDPGRLSLAVSPEGIVTKPLARVAAGLYRFDVRGVPGAGSRAIDIDVRLDGVTIGDRSSRLSGHRALPVGGDRFIALGTAHAYGGCTLSPAPRRTPLGLLGVLAFAIQRRMNRKREDREGKRSLG